MQSAEENGTIMVKLDDGDDLHSSIVRIAEKHRLHSGAIISGIGMLRDFEIGFFDGKKYQDVRTAEPMELISMLGSIAMVDGVHSIHIHAAMAGPDHRMIGGHLHTATVCVLNEIVIHKFKELSLTREINERSGLHELVVRRKREIM